jgi:hypothetical protein
MEWINFNYQGEVYDLSHLNSFEWSFTAAEGDKRPERTYRLYVTFSSHCFTRNPQPGEQIAEDLLFHTKKESRVFCFDRHEYSFTLPDIVKCLDERQCWKTGKGNFFTAEFFDRSGKEIEYEVYFDVVKTGRKGWLNLIIQTAFCRTKGYESTQPKKRRIRLHVIAYNTQIKQDRQKKWAK